MAGPRRTKELAPLWKLAVVETFVKKSDDPNPSTHPFWKDEA